jgi:hypothetical protein
VATAAHLRSGPFREAFIEDQGIELYGIGEGGKSLMLPEETIIQVDPPARGGQGL